MWSVDQVSRYLDVHRTTIQQRTRRFKRLLSDSAAPGPGEERQFTARDVAIMSEIDRLFKSGLTGEDVERQLQEDLDAGAFEGRDGFPPIDFEQRGMVPVEQHVGQVTEAQAAYHSALAELRLAQRKLDEERGMRLESERERGRLAGELARADAALDAAQQQIDAMTQQLAALRTQVGRLEGRGELADHLQRQIDELKAERDEARRALDEERGRRRGWFGR